MTVAFPKDIATEEPRPRTRDRPCLLERERSARRAARFKIRRREHAEKLPVARRRWERSSLRRRACCWQSGGISMAWMELRVKFRRAPAEGRMKAR